MSLYVIYDVWHNSKQQLLGFETPCYWLDCLGSADLSLRKKQKIGECSSWSHSNRWNDSWRDRQTRGASWETWAYVTESSIPILLFRPSSKHLKKKINLTSTCAIQHRLNYAKDSLQQSNVSDKKHCLHQYIFILVFIAARWVVCCNPTD